MRQVCKRFVARALFASPPVVVTVPTLLARWLAVGSAENRVAAILTGSAALELWLCRGLLEAMGPVAYNLYGSSEAGLVSLATPPILRDCRKINH